MSNYNQLTDAQTEAIAILAEEAAEVIQICGKILRHGFNSYSPFDENRITNTQLLEKELGGMLYASSIVQELSGVSSENILACKADKQTRVQPFLHHIGKGN